MRTGTEASRLIKIIGFSLVEIMLVLTILAIMVSGGLYQWQRYQQQQQLEQLSARMIAYLSQIQAEANWSNLSYTLVMQSTDFGWLFSVKTANSNLIHQSVTHFTTQLTSSDITDIAYPQLNPITFYGRRGMAVGGHISLTNPIGTIKVIVSARGRIRRCSEVAQQPSTITISGVAPC